MKKYLDEAVDFSMALVLMGMALIVFIQVVFRYVLNSPLSWPEETARILIVWLSFIGGYVALREKQHVSFELLVGKLPDKLQGYINIFGRVLIIVFLMVIVREGFSFASQFVNVIMPYTGVSTGWFVYSVFPVSGVLMLLQALMDLSDTLAQIKEQGNTKGAM